MYWMMMGINDRKLAVIKAVNIGHTADKNGTTRPMGPHTYRVEVTLTDKDGEVDGTPYVVGYQRTLSFTVTHLREEGHLSLAAQVLGALMEELENAAKNKDAEAFEIKRESKVLDGGHVLPT